MIATMTANMGLQPLLFDEYSGLAMVLPPFDVIQALTSFVIWVLSRSGFDKTSVRLLIDQVLYLTNVLSVRCDRSCHCWGSILTVALVHSERVRQ